MAREGLPVNLASMPTSPEPFRRADAGDETEHYQDFDEIYQDNVVRLYRLIYAKVGNRADAEDLTADVFLSAVRRIRISAHRGEVRAYLAAITRTTLASYWRRRVGREVTTIEPTTATRFLDDPAPPSDAPARARRLLDALPERYRRILELRFLEALSVKEAAQAMNVTVANAKVLQHRALAMAGAASGRVGDEIGT